MRDYDMNVRGAWKHHRTEEERARDGTAERSRATVNRIIDVTRPARRTLQAPPRGESAISQNPEYQRAFQATRDHLGGAGARRYARAWVRQVARGRGGDTMNPDAMVRWLENRHREWLASREAARNRR